MNAFIFRLDNTLKLNSQQAGKSNNDIQGNFFMHQSLWLNCTIGCWLLRWFEPLKFQLDLTPASGPRPCVCRCMRPADWEMFPMCTVPGVWSGWEPTVHYCARVSLGVGARHNCSHCISAALCVIINCPHNNWRFVILARISHSLSLQLSDLTSERRCNNHSSVGWKEKYGLKSRVFNSFTRISGEHEASLWRDNKEQDQDSYSCVPWALLSETSLQDLALASALRHRHLECNCLHKSQLGANISRPFSLSLSLSLTMNEALV